jgi:hypothetical protein
MLIKLNGSGISEFILYTTPAMAYNCQLICGWWQATFEDFEKYNEERLQKGWNPVYLVWRREDGEQALNKLNESESIMRAACQEAVENKRVK